jgi:hypothetical protein
MVKIPCKPHHSGRHLACEIRRTASNAATLAPNRRSCPAAFAKFTRFKDFTGAIDFRHSACGKLDLVPLSPWARAACSSSSATTLSSISPLIPSALSSPSQHTLAHWAPTLPNLGASQSANQPNHETFHVVRILVKGRIRVRNTITSLPLTGRRFLALFS